MIERRHHREFDLIVHTVTGELDVEEFRRTVEALYEMEPVPELSLWDLRDATLTQFTAHRILSVQAHLSPRVRGREGGRTAVVVSADLDGWPRLLSEGPDRATWRADLDGRPHLRRSGPRDPAGRPRSHATPLAGRIGATGSVAERRVARGVA